WASSIAAAFPNGVTNGTLQPYFNIVQANPFTGGAGLNVRSASTNPIYGDFIGNDKDGIPNYLEQFGLQILSLSAPYGSRDPDGTLTELGMEAQQVPGHVILNSGSQPFYISVNGSRSGDKYNGQLALFCIAYTNGPDGEILAGMPIQEQNSFAANGTNWHWGFVVLEKARQVITTNSSLL